MLLLILFEGLGIRKVGSEFVERTKDHSKNSGVFS
jgi:hypothetical protein